MNGHTTPVRIFMAYSRKDAAYLNEIRTALIPLERRGDIKLWYDGAIVAGQTWDNTIKENLHTADIVLLLLSSDSLASDYFYEQEVANALVRHHKGESKVVPIIVRDCLWEETQLADLQALPQDAKPIVAWTNPNAAYRSIAVGVKELVEEIQQNRKLHAEESERLIAEREEAERLQNEARKRRESERQQAEQDRLRAEREKAQNKRQFWEQLKEADALFDQKQYAQALTEYQNLLNWGNKSEMGYTDAQPHITQRVFVCKNEVQYANQKKQAFELHQQGKYADALALTQQLLQHRTDPEVGSLQNELTRLVGAAAAKRRQMLQQGGIAAGALLFLLLAIFGAKQLFFNNDGDNKTAALAGTTPKDTTAIQITPTSGGSTTSISPTSGGGKGGANDPFANQMIKVQGGTFTMGCTKEQEGACEDDEKPAHSVTLSDFYIGKYEVTQAQWRAVMGSDPPELYNKNCDQCPVERVSHDDIQKFLQKLNAQTGKNYRLPTEAEWEYAARGGNKSKGYKYAGSNDIDKVAWYGDNYQQSKHGDKGTTHPVGTKNANELGLYDMSGNVWEWCSDWYGDYTASPANNPQGPGTSAVRVLRGGSWNNRAQGCRVSNRGSNSPAFRVIINGFRLALPSGI